MDLKQIYFRFVSLMQRYCNKMKIALLGSKGVIFVFHEVDTENRNSVEPSSFCSVEMFIRILDENRGLFCSLDEFLTCSKDGRNIVVTFDDVPASVYIHAYPLLCKHKVPFVLYISPKFIGKKGFLSIEQIKKMAENPLCTIGAHTMNHVKLRIERDSFEDILQSKLKLESLLDKPVEHLAYPYGRADSISSKVRKEAQKAGFKSATCTIPTGVPKRFDHWYVPRVAIW